MKKIVITLSAFLACMACQQPVNQKTAALKTTENAADTASSASGGITISGYSLNGIEIGTADKMVLAFEANRLPAHEQTTVWYSKAFIDSIANFLTKDYADGARLYFARSLTDGKNAIVMISTHASATGHRDYIQPQRGHLGALTGSHYNVINTDGIASGATLYDLNVPCSNAGCFPTNAPSVIKCEDARLWVNQFRKDEQIKTNSVWYSVRLFIRLRDELNAAASINGADGVRIYLAKKATGRQTFLFVTTKPGNGGTHTDYYDCHLSLAYLKDYYEIREIDDNGEECPQVCEDNDAFWPDVD